jgi:hypothetical protein
LELEKEQFPGRKQFQRRPGKKGHSQMQLQVDRAKEIVRYASEKQAMLDEKAVALLEGNDNFKEVIDQLLEENTFIINEDAVQKKLFKTKWAQLRKSRFRSRELASRPWQKSTGEG